MKLKIGDQEVDCVNIAELALMCGRRPNALRSMEREGHLPRPNFRLMVKQNTDSLRKAGDRIYSRWLAEKLAVIMKTKIRQGVAISQATLQEIKDLFEKERRMYQINAQNQTK